MAGMARGGRGAAGGWGSSASAARQRKDTPADITIILVRGAAVT
jgi:hypothetical protein